MVLAETTIQNIIAEFITFLPRLVGAVIILILGWIIGRAVGRIVTVLVNRTELDRLTLDTPIGNMMGGTEQAVSSFFGKIAKWFVYAIAFLAAADVLAITLLSEWVSQALAYLPAFFGGLIFIIFGFIVSDFVGDMIERTRTATETFYTTYFADAVRIFLYFTVIVIGLGTMGVDVTFLYLIAGALAGGLGLAIAIGLGVALGWGSKDYIADNIDDWMQRGKEKTQDVQEG